MRFDISQPEKVRTPPISAHNYYTNNGGVSSLLSSIIMLCQVPDTMVYICYKHTYIYLGKQLIGLWITSFKYLASLSALYYVLSLSRSL